VALRVRWTVYCYQPSPRLRLDSVSCAGRRSFASPDATTDLPGVRLAAGSVCMSIDARPRIVCSCALARSRSCRRKGPARIAIRVVDASGMGLHELAKGSFRAGASWSPDGREIVAVGGPLYVRPCLPWRSSTWPVAGLLSRSPFSLRAAGGRGRLRLCRGCWRSASPAGVPF
jgi:hypothetical protein